MLAVNRAVQNPGLFTSDHYRQAALAVAAGVAIRILVSIPVCVPLLDPATEHPDWPFDGRVLAPSVPKTLPRRPRQIEGSVDDISSSRRDTTPGT